MGGGRRGLMMSENRHINRLTPVAGSEPPGLQSRQNSLNDQHPGNGRGHLGAPPGIQVIAPSNYSPVSTARDTESHYPTRSSNPQSNNPQNGNPSGPPATWAVRSKSPNRSIEVQTDYAHVDVVMSSVRSEDPNSSLPMYNSSAHPQGGPHSNPSQSQRSDPHVNPSQSQRNHPNGVSVSSHNPDTAHPNGIDPKYGSYRTPQSSNMGNGGPRQQNGTSQTTQVGNNGIQYFDNNNPSSGTTGDMDAPYPSPYHQHSSRGPQSSQPYNTQPSAHNATSHNQNYTNHSQQPPPNGTSHPNNGYNNQYPGNNNNNNGPNEMQQPYPGQHPALRADAYQHEAGDARTPQGYEPPLSASPPNSAGQTRAAGAKNTDGHDQNKYNNTSDDSGISEMDEADRRRAGQR